MRVATTIEVSLSLKVEADFTPGRPMRVYRDGSADPPDPDEIEIVAVTCVSYDYIKRLPNGQPMSVTSHLELDKAQSEAVTQIVTSLDPLREYLEEALIEEYHSHD